MREPQVQADLPVNSRDMAEIDTVLTRAITAGDPLIASDYGNQLSSAITLKGIALAKLFSGLRSNWALFRAAGIEEEFPDFIDAHMFVRGSTAIKYADMYESVFERAQLPDDLKDQLARKPIKSLMLLTAAVREGSLDEEQLEDVVLLDHQGIREMIRRARGEVTSSKTRIYAKLVTRVGGAYPPGSVVAFDGEGDSEAVGFIKLNPSTDHGKKYVERMKNVLHLQDMNGGEFHGE